MCEKAEANDNVRQQLTFHVMWLDPYKLPFCLYTLTLMCVDSAANECGTGWDLASMGLSTSSLCSETLQQELRNKFSSGLRLGKEFESTE